MSEPIWITFTGSAPPTVVGLLTYVHARAARRQTEHEQAGRIGSRLDDLAGAVHRIETTLTTIAADVTGVRERLARMEGAHTPPPTRVRRRP